MSFSKICLSSCIFPVYDIVSLLIISNEYEIISLIIITDDIIS